MIAQTIRNWKEFEQLEPEWDSLLNRAASKSIFLKWEFINSWRSVVGDSVSPFVVTVRGDDNTLLGIVPLYFSSFQLLKVIKIRALRLMADVATGAEYPDWIVDRRHQQETCAAIARELAKQSSSWDVVWLNVVAGWTGARARIAESAAENGLLANIRPRRFSSVELPESMSEFENKFSSRRRQQMRRTYRKVEKMDGVEFVRCNRIEDLPEFLEALFELHKLRWQAVGVEGCFQRKPAEAEFYRTFAPIAFNQNWLATYAVREHGVIKAIQFGYLNDGAYLQLQEGYDPGFHSGVGNALRSYAIRDCIKNGIREYDFLAGFTEHKRRWSAKVRYGHDIFIGSGSLKSRIMTTGKVWPTGRFVDQS